MFSLSSNFSDFGNTSPPAGHLFGAVGLLRPAIFGRCPAFLPKHLEIQGFKGGRRHFQHHSAAMTHDLGGDFNNPAAQRGGVANGLDHRRAHVLLEALVKKKGDQHRVAEGGIGGKALEGQLFEAEILQRPVHQLIAAPAVVTGDDLLRLKQLAVSSLDQRCIDALAHARVGDQHRVGPCKAQQHLGVFIQRPAKQSSTKPLPIVAPGAKLLIQLTAADVAYAQIFEYLEKLLKNLDVANIADKQTQTAAAGERIVCNLDTVDDRFAFCRGGGRFHIQPLTFRDFVARYVVV